MLDCTPSLLSPGEAVGWPKGPPVKEGWLTGGGGKPMYPMPRPGCRNLMRLGSVTNWLKLGPQADVGK